MALKNLKVNEKSYKMGLEEGHSNGYKQCTSDVRQTIIDSEEELKRKIIRSFIKFSPTNSNFTNNQIALSLFEFHRQSQYILALIEAVRTEKHPKPKKNNLGK